MFSRVRIAIRFFFFGLAVGVLMAPRSGQETRRLVREKADRLLNEVLEAASLGASESGTGSASSTSGSSSTGAGETDGGNGSSTGRSRGRGTRSSGSTEPSEASATTGGG